MLKRRILLGILAAILVVALPVAVARSEGGPDYPDLSSGFFEGRTSFVLRNADGTNPRIRVGYCTLNITSHADDAVEGTIRLWLDNEPVGEPLVTVALSGLVGNQIRFGRSRPTMILSNVEDENAKIVFDARVFTDQDGIAIRVQGRVYLLFGNVTGVENMSAFRTARLRQL